MFEKNSALSIYFGHLGRIVNLGQWTNPVDEGTDRSAWWSDAMTNFRSMIGAGALALLITGPVLAEGPNANGGNGNHYGWGKGNGGGVTHSAPGPEFGIGLAPLLIGGYLWYRRRSNRSK